MKTKLPLGREKDLHKAVCQYLRMQYPNVLFNSDMSGLRLTIGQATQAKNMRSNQGFPDIIVYESNHAYNALFIELKREGERILTKDGRPATPHIAEQLEVIAMLNQRGYYASIAVGFTAAKNLIDSYLSA
jgi:hypothetical protein